MTDVLEGFTREEFRDGDIARDIYRTGSGPAVIVIAEIPGITPNVISFGRRVAALGCTAVLPHLFGVPGRPPSVTYALKSMTKACVAKEFSALAMGHASPIVTWLRALAGAEHARCGGPGVGVVGMCFTGGFGLAMMVDDAVVAPVLSQPSLPFPIGKARRADIQVSEEDWRTIKDRMASDEGLCVIGLRFTGDLAVPAERFQMLKDRLGDRFLAVELDSSKGNPHGHPRGAHSVLTEHLQDREGTPTRAALDQVLDFFATRLGVAPAGPAPA